jgi:hypothetical protein
MEYKPGDLVKCISYGETDGPIGYIGNLVSNQQGGWYVEFYPNWLKGHEGNNRCTLKSGWWLYENDIVLAEEEIIDRVLAKYSES